MYFEISYHNANSLGEMMALNTLFEVKKIVGKAGKMPIHCTLLYDEQETEGENPDYSQKFCSCVYKTMY